MLQVLLLSEQPFCRQLLLLTLSILLLSDKGGMLSPGHAVDLGSGGLTDRLWDSLEDQLLLVLLLLLRSKEAWVGGVLGQHEVVGSRHHGVH